MNYIRKICPTCGSEFFVLKDVEEKAVYCTLKCFFEFQDAEMKQNTSLLLYDFKRQSQF
jgi:hypothetical protein